jgi:flagellum-specific ATP synthase
VVGEITDPAWRAQISQVRQLMSAYSSHKDLISIGAYQRGSDPRVDEALKRWPALMRFLNQDVADAADVASSRAALSQLINEGS